VPVTRQDFIYALNYFIASQAIKKLEAQKKHQDTIQLMKEQKKNHGQGKTSLC
jgi:hypothetical protein